MFLELHPLVIHFPIALFSSAVLFDCIAIVFKKNELWMVIFAFGLLYWLFNPSISMSLIMIIPLLLAALSSK